MPEATMNEDADPIAAKHHIWFPWKILLVQAVPEAMPMQKPSNLHLRGCIAAADASHHARPDFTADYVHD